MTLEQKLDAIVAAVPRTQRHVRRAVRRKARAILTQPAPPPAAAKTACSHNPSQWCRRCLGRPA